MNNSYEMQQAREAAGLAETDTIKLMNEMNDTAICRICDDSFKPTEQNDTCCEDCRLPNGQKMETIDDVLGIISSNKTPAFHAEIGSANNSDLIICELCGQTFETNDSNQDYCVNCRN